MTAAAPNALTFVARSHAHHDPELVARLEAIPVAAALATPEVRDALLGDLVVDPTDGVANAAIKAAGDTGAQALATKLAAILAQPEGNRTAAAIGALGAAAAVPAIAGHLEDRGTDANWNAKLALDALVGSPRAVPDWQAWARDKGYLPAGKTKPAPRSPPRSPLARAVRARDRADLGRPMRSGAATCGAASRAPGRPHRRCW